MGSIKKIETLVFNNSNTINNYLKDDVESRYIIDTASKQTTLSDNKNHFLEFTTGTNYNNDLLSFPTLENCMLMYLNDIKFYDKDNSITDKPNSIYDISYSNFYPFMNKLLFILDVEREILLELHNYLIKYKSIGKNIFGHQFKIRCKYTWDDEGLKVVESDLGYYEIELVLKNDQNNGFVQIYNKYTDSEITQDPTDIYINSIEKVLEIINSNTISLLSDNTASGAGELQAQKVSLNTIINSINKGESIHALYQYKRVDYLKLMLNDIIKRNLYYQIKQKTTKAINGQLSDCQWEGNSKLKKNFDYFYSNFKNYEQNHNKEFEIIAKNVRDIVNKKKASGKVWTKSYTIDHNADVNFYEDITDNHRYNKLVGYISDNYYNDKVLNGNTAQVNISLSLAQIESLAKNDFYNGNKTAYIQLDNNNYYEIAYDDILLMNNPDDEIYKTEKIFEKTTKLRQINDELEKKNKLLKTINSNVEFEKKKLDKINIVYIFTICLFILLSIILILLGSDKIDYKRGRNFINTLIFLTFIIFIGLHYYIGKIKETQKDTIKLNNILDDEIFKIKSTTEKFEVSDANAIHIKLSDELTSKIFYIVDIISKLNGFSIHSDNLYPFTADPDPTIISCLKTNSYLLTDNTKSYYNVVDPLLNKELEDYDKKNENTKMYKNIADFNLNISRRDTKFSIETINYLLNLSLLLAIILLVIFYNSDFTTIIGVIGIIIFIIISILYFTRILRIVRTDNKKKYWQKPLESDLKNL